MFRITDNAITPKKHLIEHAVRNLPALHQAAHNEATSYLHTKVVEAAGDAGWNTEPIVLGSQRGQAYVGIERTPDGDEVFDHEFGREDQAPNPVLRTTLASAKPAATQVYAEHLWRGMGLR